MVLPEQELNSPITIMQTQLSEEWSDKVGGETFKTRAVITYQDEFGRIKSGQFFLKRFNRKRTNEEAEIMAKREQSIHRDIKSIGISVPEHCFYLDLKEGPTLAYTDLTAEGESLWSTEVAMGSSPLQKMELKGTDLERFKSEIKNNSRLIKQHGFKYVLAANSYFVVGDTQKGYRLVAGDIGEETRKTEEMQDDEIFKINELAAEDVPKLLEMTYTIKS